MMSQPMSDDLEMAWTDGPVSYRLMGRMARHGPELTSIEITSMDPIAAAHIRVPLISTFTTYFGLTEGEIRPLPMRRPRPRDQGAAIHRLDEVARIARAAGYGQRARAVADWFTVSEGYARQLISRAKATGHSVWP